MRNLQKCASFFCIEWYPSKSPIELTRASPLPPTSQAKPILFGKYKCQVKLWWTSSSDVHPRFHPTLPIFRHQPFGSNKPVGKKDVGLSSSSPGQCVSKFHLSPKTTILDPQVLTDVQLKPNLVRSHPLASLLYSTSFCTILWYQHFWFNQAGWKEGRGSIIFFARSMRVKIPFKS